MDGIRTKEKSLVIWNKHSPFLSIHLGHSCRKIPKVGKASSQEGSKEARITRHRVHGDSGSERHGRDRYPRQQEEEGYGGPYGEEAYPRGEEGDGGRYGDTTGKCRREATGAYLIVPVLKCYRGAQNCHYSVYQ